MKDFYKINWDNEKEVLEAVKESADALNHASKRLRGDPNFILAAVKQNGRALKYVPEDKRDKKLCLAAVKQNGYALKQVPEDIRDKKICLTAVKQEGLVLPFVPDDILDKEICLAAVKQNGRALEYVPEEIQENNNVVVLEAVKNNSDALEYASEKLISERDKHRCFKFLKSDSSIWGRLLGKSYSLDRLLRHMDLSTDFKHEFVLTLAEHKMKEEFNNECEKKGIKDNDVIHKDLEDAVLNKMAETAAKIDLKAENDRKKEINNLNNRIDRNFN